MYLFRGADEAQFKRQLEQGIHLRIGRIGEVVALDAEQLSKLQLAAHGDLSRFYSEMGAVREQTKDLDPQKNEDAQKAWNLIMPLQQRIQQGLIGEKSLLERVLASTLTPEQRLKYDQFQREREIASYKAILRVTIADMEKSLPLTSQQRTDLIKLLLSSEFPSSVDRQMLPYVGWAMLSRLKLDDVAEILDEQQLETFTKLKEQQVGIVRMIRWK